MINQRCPPSQGGLTGRVVVNRLWEQLFGIGIVESSENLGVQAEWPSHGELLDWRAISGLLVEQIGGSSVRPYQPAGLWKEVEKRGKYQQSHGKSLYRRSLYTAIRRTVVAPEMRLFDLPSREVCTVKRSRTNTPDVPASDRGCLTAWGHGKNAGRDHHPSCFTTIVAGAGSKKGHVHGATDDYGYNIARDPVHVHDLNATILHLLGMDHERLTYKFQGRQYRLTDVHGKVIEPLPA
ncbi:MAG: DUF1553 domain-containing protein [Planctomycetes bacterium]|nr:DUF1553 domain-containing protein [Planctomycetota bacterium]